MNMFGFGPFSCSPPPEVEKQLEKEERFVDFALGILGEIGTDEMKSQISIIKSYQGTSKVLHKIVEYGFMREDLPESERAAVRDLLSQINASAKAFCENHNITEKEN